MEVAITSDYTVSNPSHNNTWDHDGAITLASNRKGPGDKTPVLRSRTKQSWQDATCTGKQNEGV